MRGPPDVDGCSSTTCGGWIFHLTHHRILRGAFLLQIRQGNSGRRGQIGGSIYWFASRPADPCPPGTEYICGRCGQGQEIDTHEITHFCHIQIFGDIRAGLVQVLTM